MNDIDFQELGFRDKASFAYTVDLTKPAGMIDHVLEWSREELSHEWRWTLVEVSAVHKPGRYTFYFDSERDYFAFIIKWL